MFNPNFPNIHRDPAINASAGKAKALPASHVTALRQLLSQVAGLREFKDESGLLKETMIQFLGSASANTLSSLNHIFSNARAESFKVLALELAQNNSGNYGEELLERLAKFEGRQDTARRFFEIFGFSDLERLGERLERRYPTVSEQLQFKPEDGGKASPPESGKVISEGSLTVMTSDPFCIYDSQKPTDPYLCGPVQFRRMLSLINPAHEVKENSVKLQARSTEQVVSEALRLLGISEELPQVLDHAKEKVSSLTGERSLRAKQFGEAITYLKQELEQLREQLSPDRTRRFAELFRVPLIAETERGLDRAWFKEHFQGNTDVPQAVHAAYNQLFVNRDEAVSHEEIVISRQVLHAYQISHRVVYAEAILSPLLSDLESYRKLFAANPNGEWAKRFGHPDTLLSPESMAVFSDSKIRVPLPQVIDLLNRGSRLLEFRAEFNRAVFERSRAEIVAAIKLFEPLWIIREKAGAWRMRTLQDGLLGRTAPEQLESDQNRKIALADYKKAKFAPNRYLNDSEFRATRDLAEFLLLNPNETTRFVSVPVSQHSILLNRTLVAFRKLKTAQEQFRSAATRLEWDWNGDLFDPLAVDIGDRLSSNEYEKIPRKGYFVPVETFADTHPFSFQEFAERVQAAHRHPIFELGIGSPEETAARKFLGAFSSAGAPAVVTEALRIGIYPVPSSYARAATPSPDPIEKWAIEATQLERADPALLDKSAEVIISPVLPFAFGRSEWGKYFTYLLESERKKLTEIAAGKEELSQILSKFDVSLEELNTLSKSVASQVESLRSKFHSGLLYGGIYEMPHTGSTGERWKQPELVVLPLDLGSITEVLRARVPLEEISEISSDYLRSKTLFAVRPRGTELFLATDRDRSDEKLNVIFNPKALRLTLRSIQEGLNALESSGVERPAELTSLLQRAATLSSADGATQRRGILIKGSDGKDRPLGMNLKSQRFLEGAAKNRQSSIAVSLARELRALLP